MRVDKNSNILDFVRVYKNIISEEKSKFIIEESKGFTWDTHRWSNYTKIVDSPTPNEDFQRVALIKPDTFKVKLLLNQHINQVLSLYSHETGNRCETIGLSPINLNKYDANTRMFSHHDHIHSIFDGTAKGIPILTVLGLLHSDFKGGEFTICNDHVPDYQCGDIIVFPSVFLYPHEVKTITAGERYSFVSWAY